MRRIYTIPFLALFFIPFCGNRQAEKQISKGSDSVNESVRLDVLKAACERRLSALEVVTIKPTFKNPVVVPISASEAINYDPANKSHK